jgi:uncharacterized membrane protein HdeD (DUF308 family)
VTDATGGLPSRAGTASLVLGIVSAAAALVIGILFVGINALTFFALAALVGLSAIITGIVALVVRTTRSQRGAAIAGIVVGGALPIVALFVGRAIGGSLGIA